MIVLNLAYREKSDIMFDTQRFPDGQQNVVLDVGHYRSRLVTHDGHWNRVPVMIKARLNNFRDLELILCAVSCLRELDTDIEINLFVPFFMGARSDRKFQDGGNRYLKDVICPIINSIRFKTVTTIDPHSYVLENLLNGFRRISNTDFVKWCVRDHLRKMKREDMSFDNSFRVLAPDEGASKKIYKLAKEVGFGGEIITCSKERDERGNLSRVVVPLLPFVDPKDIILIDDICDGGATFINIAKEVVSKFKDAAWGGYRPKMYLIVTHGIFSKGFGELSLYFDGIFCTNSYSDWPCTQEGDDLTCYVHQLNIF